MASKRKTTIKDIADAAGVSVALVSFVMNNMSGGKYRVSAKTTKKILSISEELNYQPNNAARSLRKGRSNTIGVILSDISNPFFPISPVASKTKPTNINIRLFSAARMRTPENWTT